MAAQWRIRHKLMFGLALVVGTMILLLGGTLRGLWSYYLTMNSIRGKLTELRAAVKFKESVNDVVRLSEDSDSPPQKNRELRPGFQEPARMPMLLQKPDPLAEAYGETTAPEKKPANLSEAIAMARARLKEYEGHLQDSLRQGRDPLNGEHALGLIQRLSHDFKDLDATLAHRTGEMLFGSNANDHELRDKERRAILGPIKRIASNTDDLYSIIYEELKKHIDASRDHYQSTLRIVLPASVVGLVLVFGLLCSFYAWIFHPIRDLEAGVQRVANGDFTHRIEVHSGDEMEHLASAFNDMMQRLQDLYSDLARQVNERSRQLVRSERLASVGFLAAGVAHEINNPLASIAFCSEALEARLEDLLRQMQGNGRGGEDGAIFAKYLKMIQEEAFRCKNITERLLAFSRSSERQRAEVDLRELVQSVLDVAQHLQNHRGKHITLAVDADRLLGGRITAWISAEEIKSVVLNLVVNALDSMDDGGQLTIYLGQRAGMAELRFTDSGCGMTPEVLENIFEPFFTRNRTGKGTGLGLTISHGIINQHGGDIEASSPGPNQGSTFTVRLPLRPPEGGAASSGPNAEARPNAPGLAA